MRKNKRHIRLAANHTLRTQLLETQLFAAAARPARHFSPGVPVASSVRALVGALLPPSSCEVIEPLMDVLGGAFYELAKSALARYAFTLGGSFTFDASPTSLTSSRDSAIQVLKRLEPSFSHGDELVSLWGKWARLVRFTAHSSQRAAVLRELLAAGVEIGGPHCLDHANLLAFLLLRRGEPDDAEAVLLSAFRLPVASQHEQQALAHSFLTMCNVAIIRGHAYEAVHWGTVARRSMRRLHMPCLVADLTLMVVWLMDATERGYRMASTSIARILRRKGGLEYLREQLERDGYMRVLQCLVEHGILGRFPVLQETMLEGVHGRRAILGNQAVAFPGVIPGVTAAALRPAR